jgi:hypothetical protein
VPQAVWEGFRRAVATGYRRAKEKLKILDWRKTVNFLTHYRTTHIANSQWLIKKVHDPHFLASLKGYA